MSTLSFGKKRRKRLNYELIQEIAGWAFQIALVCFAAFLIVWFFGHEVSMIGSSMQPRLKNGDITLINRLVYETRRPRRGEVIAFRPNGNEEAHYYIRRVIALPGETVEYTDGKLLIDGKELKEDYAAAAITDPGTLAEPVKLGQTEYFVLGDDRQSGEDSRLETIGMIRKQDIAGRVWFVISPMKHIGFVR